MSAWSGEAWQHQQTWLDSIDPRVRVLSCLLFALVVLLSDHFGALLIALLAAMLMLSIAKLALKQTLRRLLAMDAFMLLLILVLPFSTPGEAMFTLFELPASWQGLRHALLIAIKANAVLLMVFALLATLSASTLGHALAHLKMPDKLVHLMLFMVRYLDVIVQEYSKMRRAMQARCFVLGFNRHTWINIGYLFAMLLVRSVARAERIYQAMLCRGFCGRFYLNDEMQLQRHDGIFAAFFVAFLALLIGVNIYG